MPITSTAAYIIARLERDDVKQLIMAEVDPVRAHGGLREEGQGSNPTLEPGRGLTYTLKRLKLRNPGHLRRGGRGASSSTAS